MFILFIVLSFIFLQFWKDEKLSNGLCRIQLLISPNHYYFFTLLFIYIYLFTLQFWKDEKLSDWLCRCNFLFPQCFYFIYLMSMLRFNLPICDLLNSIFQIILVNCQFLLCVPLDAVKFLIYDT